MAAGRRRTSSSGRRDLTLRPDGHLRQNDLIALGGLQRNCGEIEFPRLVAAAGFDCALLATASAPSLISVRQSVRWMSRRLSR
jgi:DNA-binding LacI/PurR family transcriptional regulator